MLKTKEVENVKSLEEIIVNEEGCCKIPLFHGTRRYAIQTTESDRQRFYDACKVVILFAKELALGQKIDSDALAKYQRTTNLMFLSTVVYGFETSSAYEYGDLYVTSSFSNAFGYTYNVGGELGEWAYYQCKGFKDFGIELDENVKAATEIVIEEYEKYRCSERIILVYYCVKFTDMLNQGGSTFWLEQKDMSRRIERLYKDKDSDTVQYNSAFRLLNPDTYTAYVLSEKNFREGFEAFTNISNVDRFIANHNLFVSAKWSL